MNYEYDSRSVFFFPPRKTRLNALERLDKSQLLKNCSQTIKIGGNCKNFKGFFSPLLHKFL